MGLTADIYKSQGRSFSNGGLSERVDRVTLVNVDGPFEPTDDAPAAMLVAGNLAGCAKVVAAEWLDVEGHSKGGGWIEKRGAGAGPMMGGCYVETSDERFREAVRALTGEARGGPVALHDRYETVKQYASYD